MPGKNAVGLDLPILGTLCCSLACASFPQFFFFLFLCYKSCRPVSLDENDFVENIFHSQHVYQVNLSCVHWTLLTLDINFNLQLLIIESSNLNVH